MNLSSRAGAIAVAAAVAGALTSACGSQPRAVLYQDLVADSGLLRSGVARELGSALAAGDAAKLQLSAAELERLRALGYGAAGQLSR